MSGPGEFSKQASDTQNNVRPRDPLADYRLSPLEISQGHSETRLQETKNAEDAARWAYTIPQAFGQDQPAPSDIWPPPPAGQIMDSISAAEILGMEPGRYRSVMGLSWIVIGLVAGVTALTCMLPVLYKMHLTPGTWQGDLFEIDCLLFFAAAVSFLFFTGRAYGNLAGFQAGGLSSTAAGAAFSFLIPGLNLWLPINIYQEIWRASSPHLQSADPFAWKLMPSNTLFPIWWISYLPTLVAVVMIPYTLSIPLGLLASAVAAVSTGSLTIVVVRAVALRQKEKRNVIEQRHAALGQQYTPEV